MFITKKRYGRDMDEAEGRGYEQGVTLGYRLGFDAGYGVQRISQMARDYRKEMDEQTLTTVPQCWIKGMEDKDERG